MRWRLRAIKPETALGLRTSVDLVRAVAARTEACYAWRFPPGDHEDDIVKRLRRALFVLQQLAEMLTNEFGRKF